MNKTLENCKAPSHRLIEILIKAFAKAMDTIKKASDIVIELTKA